MFNDSVVAVFGYAFCIKIRGHFRLGRRVGVHFVYHLPEVIVRRNALLVKSQTGKCQVGGGGVGGGVPGLFQLMFSRRNI